MFFNVRRAAMAQITLASLAVGAAAPRSTAQTPVTAKPQAPAALKAPKAVRAENAAPQAVVAPVLVALPGSVPDVVKRAQDLGRLDPNTPMTTHLCFQFADPQGIKNYVDAVSDPNSLVYGQWLTPQEVAQRFGPAPEDYGTGLQFAQAAGLNIADLPAHGLSIALTGTAAQMEKAFGVELHNYLESPADAARRGPNEAPWNFYANATPILLPTGLAAKSNGVLGLQSYTRPIPQFRKRNTIINGPFTVGQSRSAYDLTPLYNSGMQGQGRTVGISNYRVPNVATNAALFINANGLPVPAGGAASNISRVTVTSPSTTPSVEADLDYQMVLGMAPLSSIIIYDSQNDPYGVLSKEASDNLVDVVTESYGFTITGSDADAFHSIHATLSAQGITYLAASGDYGNIANTQYVYPADESEVLVIGGTLLQYDTTAQRYSAETGWSGSGGGHSNDAAFINNILPTYQKGRNVPTTPNQRLSPDISSVADGNGGAYYFYAYGGLNTGSGTSFSSPIMAGSLAVVEQYLISKNALPTGSAGKRRLGRLNDRIYGFNGRNDIFHDVKAGYNGYSAGSYWDYVTGWGSLDLYNFAIALQSPLNVAVTPSTISLAAGQSVSLSAVVTGSVNTGYTWSLASGPGSVTSAGIYTAPASVTTTQTAVVKATSVLDTAGVGVTTPTFQPTPFSGSATVTLLPARTISGAVSLEGISDPSQTVVPVNPVTFVLTPGAGGTPITKTQTLGAGGVFSLTGIPAGSYTLTAKGDKWLRAATTVLASKFNVSGVAFTLPGGDANNDNMVDILDFGALVNAYGTPYVPGNTVNGYDPTADFNNDGVVDVLDFGILINNYGTVGSP